MSISGDHRQGRLLMCDFCGVHWRALPLFELDAAGMRNLASTQGWCSQPKTNTDGCRPCSSRVGAEGEAVGTLASTICHCGLTKHEGVKRCSACANALLWAAQLEIPT